MNKNVKCNCASYSRLSREDREGSESNSIKNQKELIKTYIESTPELHLSLEIEDDGFSGVDFLRPGFEKLMKEVKVGKVNCIIVKDLSRFGRNHLEVGDYIDKIFPFLGVRFIAINDGYDSNNPKTSADEILIPFRNLINENYLRDTSQKIRSQFEIKRKKGEFVGAFAPYGYNKKESDKNCLVIDRHAAEIVKQIFNWKIEGYSNQASANILNKRGEASPYEYRKQKGENFTTPFKVNAKSEWTSKTIGRLLDNQVYIGDLVQGKRGTPNHKIKQVIEKPVEEWIVVKDTHEPIITRNLFEIVQRLQKIDTRIGARETKLYPFSGIVYCADCASSMCRKTNYSNTHKYHYLVCKGHKQYKNCSSHIFSENKLTEVVFIAIQKHIAAILEYERVIERLSLDFLHLEELKRLENNLDFQMSEIEKIQNLKMHLYEDLKALILTKEEYDRFHKRYSDKIIIIEEKVTNIQNELDIKKNDSGTERYWIDYFKEHKNVTDLSRSLIVTLIKNISIDNDGSIEIEFYYQDKFNYIGALLKKQSYNANLIDKGGCYGTSK